MAPLYEAVYHLLAAFDHGLDVSVGRVPYPAFEVELVDKTGSGDAFAGALAAYCAVKDDVREAVKFASAAGALACTKFGSIEALPTKAEIIELLQKQEA